METDQPVIAFIGAGHLTSHLLAGLVQAQYPVDRLWVSAPRQEVLDSLHEGFSVHVTTDNAEAAAAADVVIVAVRPQQVSAVADDIRSIIVDQQTIIVSVAIAMTISCLQGLFGEQACLVRAMPNLPSAVGAGVTGLYADAGLSDVARDTVEKIFHSMGVVSWLSAEKLIDVVTVCMGSGPGYCYYMMDQLRDYACQHGLPADMAELFIVHTMLGSAKLALLSDKGVADLQEAVTVPGGTTASIIASLEERGLSDVLQTSLAVGLDRIAALSEKSEV